MMIVRSGDFNDFLYKISRGLGKFEEVYVPLQPGSGSYYFNKITGPDLKFDLNSYRTVTPLKFLLYPAREKVYPSGTVFPKRLIAGVKACDLHAINLLDDALLKGDFADPEYQKWRECTYIVSADCSEITETCHCVLYGNAPFSEKGYDLNVSRLNGNYLLLSNSTRGDELIDILQNEKDTKISMPEDLKLVQENRAKVYEKVKEQNKIFEKYDSSVPFRKIALKEWELLSKECVGCGACTNICPTCYCLILNDESRKDNFIKVRSYDSCQWNGYARVAGGGTPRPKMHERFRNRYLCKLDYMNHNFSRPGCTGCGRCTEACTAGISFRDAIKKLSERAAEIVSN